MIRTKQQRRRNRSLQDRAVPGPVPDGVIVSVAAGPASSNVVLTFTKPVIISAPPTGWTFGAEFTGVDAVVAGNGTETITLNLLGDVDTGEPYACPQDNTHVQCLDGAHVSASTGLLA